MANVGRSIVHSAPVTDLPGVGPKRAEQLARLGIATVEDLLRHFPRAYEDRRDVRTVASLSEGDTATVIVEVVSAKAVHLRGRKNLCVAEVEDDTGTIRATWFGRGFLARNFHPGTRLVLTGEVVTNKGLCLRSPDFEILGEEADTDEIGGLHPVYPLTEGISQRQLRGWIFAALDARPRKLADPLPAATRARYGWPSLRDAFERAHRPTDPGEAEKARERFVYEELLRLQRNVIRARARRMASPGARRHRLDGPGLAALRNALPFRPTRAQQRATEELLADMAAPFPMGRLLQGDVGSGKTVVAAHAVAAALDGGYQAALMAPTELLAEQHYRVLRGLLEACGVTTRLLTANAAGAAETRSAIAANESCLVVGTHALIQKSVVFANLGLVIVDEQHRFGVQQRATLAAKGIAPDTLHMSATPIPRTLALTVYGAMDLTVIDELPPGREPVATSRIDTKDRDTAYHAIAEEAAKGLQAFVVCPVIDGGDTGTNKRTVLEHIDEIADGPLAGVRCALVHGRMKPEERDVVMRQFEAGAVDVLFSTTIVEVGIDVPRATVMAIEDAHHFGLTQLHQLRGRVGRGEAPGRCFLISTPPTPEARERLNILCESQDGFEIAEADLRLRGSGDIAGLRQSGDGDLRIADLIRDARWLDRARRDAEALEGAGSADRSEAG